MPTTGFSDWYRATTLVERLAGVADRRMVEDASRLASSRGRLQRWRSQPPFDDPDLFARRLAVDGLQEEDLLALLAEPVEALARRLAGESRWWVPLAAAWPENDPMPRLSLPEPLGAEPLAGFLQGVAPLLEGARQGLRDGLAKALAGRRSPPFEVPRAVDMVLGNVCSTLIPLLSRTLVLELNVARLEGSLSGDTPQERFLAFVERLRSREVALAVLREYPVLARQVTATLEHWVAFSLELFGHLLDDWDELPRLGLDPDPGPLAAVEGGVGDTHSRGRSVLILAFENGQRLVYKPRALSVDGHFQRLLGWLNERGAEPSFPILRVMDRGDHGWVELVAHEGCESEAQVQRFFRRLGGYLALAHVLEATDIHFENLIASGENPYLIDLEALFHPRAEAPRLPQPDLRIVQRAVASSVLQAGLLPFRIGEGEGYGGIDMSGLASPEGQLTPDPVLQWERAATDEMTATRRRMVLPEGHNQATLRGRPVDVLTWADDIVAGFEKTYGLVEGQRRELLSPGGPLAWFAGDEVRAVLRSTRTYHLILSESFHPDLLRDALDRDRHFDHLWRAVEDQPHLARVFAAERRDLHRGDIPLFTSRPESRDLWSSDGERLPDFFAETALEVVRRKVSSLGAADRRRQVWFIRAALGTLALSRDDLVWPSYPQVEPPEILSQETLARQCLAGARAVAERIESLALTSGDDVTWVGLAYSQERWSLVALMEDLYSGTPGLALFLAYLGELTDESRYRDLARRAVLTLRRRLEHTASDIATLGAFQGWGSLLYVFSHLAVLWRDPGLLEAARGMVARLEPLIHRDEDLDVVGGASGCILALASLDTVEPLPAALEAARRCGEKLLSQARGVDGGLAWQTRVPSNEPLTGFSHGASGMATALFRLAAWTGESRFQDAALAASRFEHRRRVATREREGEKGDKASSLRAEEGSAAALKRAWCYGTTGVGLARLKALESVTERGCRGDEAWLRQDLDFALDETLTGGFGRNHCLCHGDLGNLDLLLQARDALPDEAGLAVQVRRLGTMVLRSLETHGWLCGTPLGVESPGLMNGLAGIGYGLLRLACPREVPSVLTLDPPRTRRIDENPPLFSS